MYRKDLDVLKGIAIIVVVLFHFGYLSTGYLGVDLFLVINGYLVVPSLVKSVTNNSFSLFSFFEKRLLRLLPLIVISSAVSLLLGFFLMMPDHYENLAQSVIASNFMSENILSVLTTQNYWDVVNDYKPLMHLWYVGIIFQFYIICLILLGIGKMISKFFSLDCRKTIENLFLIVSIFSLIVYFVPEHFRGGTFYLIPSRFFEMGLVGYFALKLNDEVTFEKMGVIKSMVLLILVGLFLFGLFGNVDLSNNVYKTVLLLCTILLSIVLVLFNNISFLNDNNFLSIIGKMSYSIFIWHQIFLAFYRYTIISEFRFFDILLLLFLVILFSWISYNFVEKKIQISIRSLVCWGSASVLLCLSSCFIYMRGGVLYDIPELDVTVQNAHRGMFGEYCDRVYNMEKSFEDSNKKKILVVGNSFARDFVNVILESSYRDTFSISYAYSWDEDNIKQRIEQCDLLFVHSLPSEIPNSISELIPKSTIVKGIGTKSFGECNGRIFVRRNFETENYFESTCKMEKGIDEKNEQMKREWNGNYVDFIEPVRVKDNEVRVFSSDHKYISQDCRHLTQAGARWYASKFNWTNILGNQ